MSSDLKTVFLSNSDCRLLTALLPMFFYSSKGRYSYHWERRPFNGTIYRHDNAPHHKWKNIGTFPKHFHDGQDHNVSESFISDDPIIAVGEFLSFVRQQLIVSNI